MTIKIAEAYKPLFKPFRNMVYYGGRGSGKSWAFAQALLLQGAQKKLLILCTREFQGSIQDSVHRLLSSMIDKMGLATFYRI
ncbi:MAG TPA: PBSX family phage terminase large subunit, partial [Gammaproteobacteria bacterium]|nr:PBSX family phage terminase large subunit [Gammaproteobacteria bacterium]